MKKLLLLFGLSFLLGNANAQPYLGIHFIGSSPLNMFCDSAYRDGFGLNLEFFSDNLTRNVIRPNAFDLRWGLGFDYQGSGREKYDVILNTPNNDPGEMKLSNSHIALTANLRMTFAGESRLSPYLDGFVAWRGFHSYQTLTMDDPDPEYETTTQERILGRSTFHYGASVGAMYRLNRIVSLDTRATYSIGSATDWVNLNTVQRENNTMTYRQSHTITDLFMFRVGFVFRLAPEKKAEDTREYTTPVQQTNYSDTLSTPDTSTYIPPQTPNPPKQKPRPVSPTQPKPKPAPKKPLEVKPLPPPPPKPKPQH